MENVTASQWRQLISENENHVILDVRTPAECDSGILESAQVFNFLDVSAFMEGLDALDKSKTYFVYCRSGNRSGQACSIMDQHGFNKTYNLIGGMMHWDGNIVPNK